MKNLALKYRPTTFSDVVGQNENCKILEYQIKNNSFNHCLLFSGHSGTGKTTLARIFANSIDAAIVELDAASNNSIDDVREIIHESRLKPITNKYKVFILDECHAFSNSAFQALLKVLEEPPTYVVFILCTTDTQKLPNTILSRAQRFNFTRLSSEEIINRLEYILIKESSLIKYDKRALKIIANMSNGGMRDAIMKLDEVLGYYKDDITVDSIIKCFGLTDLFILNTISLAILNKEGSKLINCIEDIYFSGVDLKLFLSNFIQFILDIANYKLLKNENCLNVVLDINNHKKLIEKDYGILISLLETLLNIQNEIKQSSDIKNIILSRLLIFVEKI